MMAPERSAILEPPGWTSTVAKLGDGFVTDDEGWTIGCYLPSGSVSVGDLIEYWGRGIGYSVRGLAVGGKVDRYRTADEQDRWQALENRRSDARKVERYVDNKAKQDEQYASLPDVFQRRIDRFRDGCPEFRWEFEPYEMVCCIDAVKVARWAGMAEAAVIGFVEWSYDEQRAAVDLDEGHSGNTFGMAMLLARLWCSDPEPVVTAHGAMVPLVGCEAYGCTHPEAAA